MTTREPDCRAKEIYSGATGVPVPFDVAFACSVVDCAAAEKRAHERLRSYRINESREFFQVPPDVARKVVLEVCGEINSEHGMPGPAIAIDWISADHEQQNISEKYEEKYGKVYSIPIDLIEESDIGTSVLTPSQKERVKILSYIFLEVYGDADDSWHDSFSRDTNPEPEIRIWEHIAKAFLKVDQIKFLDAAAKTEAYELLLRRSAAPPNEVLRKTQLKFFTVEAARKIMASYELPPTPIKLSLPNSSKESKRTIYPRPMVSAIQSIFAAPRVRR